MLLLLYFSAWLVENVSNAGMILHEISANFSVFIFISLVYLVSPSG